MRKRCHSVVTNVNFLWKTNKLRICSSRKLSPQSSTTVGIPRFQRRICSDLIRRLFLSPFLSRATQTLYNSWPRFLGSWAQRMHDGKKSLSLFSLTGDPHCSMLPFFLFFLFESLFGHGLDSWKYCGCCWFKFSFSSLYVGALKSLSFCARERKKKECHAKAFSRHESRLSGWRNFMSV